MVKTSSIIFIAVSFLLSGMLPIILAFTFHRKLKFLWKSVLIGALIFLIFQVLTRVPLIGYLSQKIWFKEFQTKHFVIYGFLLSLTAGLCEEIGRFIGFKFFLKSHLIWENGIGYGIGHGGLESVTFVGINYLIYLIVSIVINTGHSLPSVFQPVMSLLTQTPSYQFLLDGIERVFALTVQIGFSLIVLYAVKNRKISFLFLAILLHTLLDFTAVLISRNVLLAESVVGIFAIISFMWILKSRKYLEVNTSPMQK
jgi:uncharacterized membrane protein YhfC